MNPFGSLLDKFLGLFNGIFLVIDLAVIVPLNEADTFAAAKVNGRNDYHFMSFKRLKNKSYEILEVSVLRCNIFQARHWVDNSIIKSKPGKIINY
jgi:hypothetical protein